MAIIGTQPELGSWNAGSAASLSWSAGDVWTTTLDFPLR